MLTNYYDLSHPAKDAFSSHIKWEPYDGPCPAQPHIAVVLDAKAAAKAKGISIDEAMYGKFAAESMVKIQRKVQDRNPWRKEDEKPRHLRSYELAKLSRQAIQAYSSRDVHEIDVVMDGYHDGVAAHAFGTFHAPALPYVTPMIKASCGIKSMNAAANLLTEMDEHLTLNGSLGKFSLTSNDEVLNAFAERLSRFFSGLFASGFHFLDLDTCQPMYLRESDIRTAFDIIQDYLNWDNDEFLALLERYGVEPTESRLSDTVWCRRRLRSVKALKASEFYRAFGFVHNHAEPVIADQVLSDRKYAIERNNKTLQNTVVFNNANPEEWLTLFSVSEASVSNPEMRRIELMVRIKAFEQIAQKSGHVGLFLTFTAPSRFHAYHKKSGKVNQNWLDAGKPTVKQASDWLVSAWAEMRTAFKDAAIRPYGFRFVEPHHDGTPHWHLILFVSSDQIDQVEKICLNYLLPDDDPDSEYLMQEHQAGKEISRFRSVHIDPAKGSAIAYCAAYVAKNLDGKTSKENHDETGKPMSDMIARVDAWRSAHNIRQFAQIGGPSITSWREMRRCRNEFQRDSDMFSDLTEGEWFLLENIRRATDVGDFEQYTIAMGGVQVKRNDQTIRVAYGSPEAWQKTTEAAVDQLFGNIEQLRTRYGDIAKESITGFLFRRVLQQIHPKYVPTRFKTWSTADKKRFLSTVKDQFDVLEKYEAYIRMQDEQYEKMMVQVDLAETLIDQQFTFVENSLNSDFIDSLESAVFNGFGSLGEGDLPPLAEGWGVVFDPLDQCH